MSNEKPTKKRGRGRPPLPKKHVKANIIPMRLKDEELKAFTKAAKAKNQTLSEWMRESLRDVAGMNAEQPANIPTGRRATR
jgi:truncated hemoglobin YjbI